jgi:hypothetical protein
MAVYDVLPKAECRGGEARPVNRCDKRRFNVAYRDSKRRFNGVYYSIIGTFNVIPSRKI